MALAHVRRGSGPPLVLIHGIGSQWQMWQPVLDRVSREREVVALDLPGFGDSEEHRRGHGRGAGRRRGRSSSTASGWRGRTWPATRSAAASRSSWRAWAPCARPARSPPPASSTTARAATRAAVLIGSRRVAKLDRAARRACCGGPVRRDAHLLPPRREALEDPGRPGGGRAAQPRQLARLRDHVRGDRGLPLDRARAELPGDGRVGRQGPDPHLLAPGAPRAAAAPDARHVTLTGCGHVPTWDDPEQVARVLLESSSAVDPKSVQRSAKRRWRWSRAMPSAPSSPTPTRSPGA